jgi:hypothetical protein
MSEISADEIVDEALRKIIKGRSYRKETKELAKALLKLSPLMKKRNSVEQKC